MAAIPLECRSLERARRTLGLTLTLAVVIVLALPVGVRSAQPGDERIARLLEAAEAPNASANRGGPVLLASALVRGDAFVGPVAYESLEPQPRTPPSVTVTPQILRAPVVVDGSVWDALAQCESSGNWAINTGNGYYGGLQFLPSTWIAYGGPAFDTTPGVPFPFTREEQIAVAERLRAARGFYPWPACAAKLGLI